MRKTGRDQPIKPKAAWSWSPTRIFRRACRGVRCGLRTERDL